ncbi:hypothetical protein [Catelliglobosispora koreensis]|uniref:hypothetical protein n=1 Tax=Catelliglobosispora koreensis TaxID=129052 RepID=UPI000377C89D|nr:hypothetical protein [Catelliglobosispora koreensis]
MPVRLAALAAIVAAQREGAPLMKTALACPDNPNHTSTLAERTAKQLEAISGWIDTAVTQRRDPAELLEQLQNDLCDIAWRLREGI